MTTRRVTFVVGLEAVTLLWPYGPPWPFGVPGFTWALADTDYVPDEVSGQYMDAVAPYEIVDGSYARVLVSGVSFSPVPPASIGDPGFLEYLCDDPDFGVMSDGAVAGALVLFYDVGGADSANPIVAVYPVSYTADGSDAIFYVAPLGALVVSTVCPAEFQNWGS